MRRMPLNATDIEKFNFISYDFQFPRNKQIEIPLIGDYQNNIYYKMFCKFQTGVYQNIPAIIFDESSGLYTGLINDPNNNIFYGFYDNKNIQKADINIYIENNILHVNIYYTIEEVLSSDNVKTIFGQDITGTGNINLYRHQMTITDGSVSVTYIVNSSSDVVVDNLDKFKEVTKANTISDYTGLALYSDASNSVKPAFIRYSAGTVIIQVQNGSVSPMTSVSDIVTAI